MQTPSSSFLEKEPKSYDLSKYSTKDLIAMKSEAIENMDFDLAQACKAELEAKKDDGHSSEINTAIAEIDRCIEAAAEEYNSKKDSILQEAEQSELVIRERADQAFQAMQARHIDELVRIEKSFALEVIKSRKRPIKLKIEYERQAKLLAYADNFDAARRYRQRAAETETQELTRRKQQIDTAFEATRKQLLSKQKSELSLLNEKLTSELESLRISTDSLIETARKTFRKTVLSSQQKVVAQLSNFEANPDKRKKVAEQVNFRVAEQVQHYTDIVPDWRMPQSKAPTTLVVSKRRILNNKH